MICVICPQEERHHNRLALAYVTETLREEEGADFQEMRGRLQQHLWESKFYDVPAVYGVWKSSVKLLFVVYQCIFFYTIIKF